MTDVKLLTEAEWRRLLAPYCAEEAVQYLGERGLIAPEPVDPLLIEAREIVIATTPQPQRNFNIRKAEIRRGWKDDGFCVQIALAALRRGMELAKPELTREMVREAIHEGQRRHHGGTGTVSESFLEGVSDALHAALTEQVRK